MELLLEWGLSTRMGLSLEWDFNWNGAPSRKKFDENSRELEWPTIIKIQLTKMGIYA